MEDVVKMVNMTELGSYIAYARNRGTFCYTVNTQVQSWKSIECSQLSRKIVTVFVPEHSSFKSTLFVVRCVFRFSGAYC